MVYRWRIKAEQVTQWKTISPTCSTTLNLTRFDEILAGILPTVSEEMNLGLNQNFIAKSSCSYSLNGTRFSPRT